MQRYFYLCLLSSLILVNCSAGRRAGEVRAQIVSSNVPLSFSLDYKRHWGRCYFDGHSDGFLPRIGDCDVSSEIVLSQPSKNDITLFREQTSSTLEESALPFLISYDETQQRIYAVSFKSSTEVKESRDGKETAITYIYRNWPKLNLSKLFKGEQNFEFSFWQINLKGEIQRIEKKDFPKRLSAFSDALTVGLIPYNIYENTLFQKAFLELHKVFVNFETTDEFKIINTRNFLVFFWLQLYDLPDATAWKLKLRDMDSSTWIQNRDAFWAEYTNKFL